MSARPRLSDATVLAVFLDDDRDASPVGVLVYSGKTVEKLSSRIWANPLPLALFASDFR